MSAYIEELQDSIINSNVDLCVFGSKQTLPFRLKYKTSTQMCWITKRAVIDRCSIVYNPRTLIILILN